MPDVSRALLLPAPGTPDDSTLKTLALYWDSVVISDAAFAGT